MRLDSGDVMVMSKEARLCYHGVPRIIKGSLEEGEFLGEYGEAELDEEWDPKREEGCEDLGDVNSYGLGYNSKRETVRYLMESRINMNFRQVEFGEG